MVKVIKQKDKELYQYEECGFKYADRKVPGMVRGTPKL